MRLDVGTVDRGGADDTGAAGHRGEHRQPNALAAPAIEAIVNRGVRPVLGRAVAPPRTGAQHMQDAADHPAVIHPMRPLAPPRQQGLKPKPLRIAQPVKLPHPSLPPTGSLNHEITSRGIPLLGTDPRADFAQRESVEPFSPSQFPLPSPKINCLSYSA